MNNWYELALTYVKGIGVVSAKKLLTHFGSAEAVFKASRSDLLVVPGIGPHTVAALSDKQVFQNADKEMAFMEKHRINGLAWASKNYPKRLMECADAPVMLFYRGTADLDHARIVSIVGTRHATAYGKGICDEFIRALQAYGVMVVSGLAYGIDSCAHKASVKYNIPTVGVLGHGLDRIYPDSNRGLAANMLENGGLITEYPSDSLPERGHFPERNRIIAGLADVTVVVEGALRGGALITAEIANNYNRDVCAFPGNIQQEFSTGCNYLIKTHRANLITRVEDLEYLMNWEPKLEKINDAQLSKLNVSAQEEKLYKIVIENGQVSIDTLALMMDIPTAKLALILLEMELKGLLAALPGKVFRAV
ncbi:DNA processing protein [bacterium A37T11]|nr:DNA processing protein [bacterium A37T11]